MTTPNDQPNSIICAFGCRDDDADFVVIRRTDESPAGFAVHAVVETDSTTIFLSAADLRAMANAINAELE